MFDCPSLSLYKVFYWFVWVDVTFFMGAKGWKSNLHVVATPMAATIGLPPLVKGMVAGPRCVKTGAGVAMLRVRLGVT